MEVFCIKPCIAPDILDEVGFDRCAFDELAHGPGWRQEERVTTKLLIQFRFEIAIEMSAFIFVLVSCLVVATAIEIRSIRVR